MAGFNTAVTGIKATTTALDVAGNNIANASTIGFKSTRAEFSDIYATQVVGAGSSNISGSGVLVSDLAQDFSSGTIEFTNSNLDLAINGSGFFQLKDGQDNYTYTRGGAFELDKDGYIVSKNGKNLQGYGLDAQGNTTPIENLQVTEKESRPHATENIALSVNLEPAADLAKKADYYTKTDTSSYAYTTTMKTFDSLGNAQTIKFNYVEQKANREVHQYDLAAAPAAGTPATASSANTSNVVSISGVPIEWQEVGTATAETAALSSAGKVYEPTAATLAVLEAEDPRIDLSTIRYSVDDTQLTYKLKSEFTGQGDLVVAVGTGGVAPDRQNIDNVDSQGRPELVAANESLTFDLDATKFPVGGLAADTTITIGGVDILLEAGIDMDTAGKKIALQNEKEIKDRDSNIESVTYDDVANKLVITWKPEAGDVYSNTAGGYPITGAGIFSSQTLVEGDNSYLGSYRVYAYLDDDQLLNIGKLTDPGESTGAPALLNFVGKDHSEPGPVMLKFSSVTGLLESINGEPVTDQDNVPKLTIRSADKANPQDLPQENDVDGLRGVQVDLGDTTRWEDDSIVKSQDQDGYAKGDLIGVSFDKDGKMVAAYSNGQKQNIGIVAMATFDSQAGLQPAGDTEWVPTLDSGSASLNPPGTGLNGSIRSGALEQSNVDLSAELVKLIEYQRNYQANSKTLETLNTVTQSILQI